MPELQVYFLGSPRLTLNGTPVATDRRKAMALFAYLALANGPQQRDSLAALLWPDYDTSRAYAYLRRALWEINSSIGEGWLTADRDEIGLERMPGFWLDVDAFREEAKCSSSSLQLTECLQKLENAVQLYQGDFLAGFSIPDSAAFDEWQFFQAEELRQVYVSCLQRLVEGWQEHGNEEKSLVFARRWLSIDPLHEPVHRSLMRLFARMGQRSAAIRQYEQCVSILQEQLGVPPEEETVRLYEEIRSGKYSYSEKTKAAVGEVSQKAHPVPPPIPPAAAPAFINIPPQVTPFVGRTEELAQVKELVLSPACRMLTLTGPGGIGKTRLATQAAIQLSQENLSSFMDGICFIPLAGLTEPNHIIPTIIKSLRLPLQEEHGDVLQQLQDYLRQKKMLLVLDNFEHLVTEESIRIPMELVTAGPGIKVLITSRASLNLTGEQLYPVMGMRTPEENRVDGNLDELVTFSAVRLFLESARRVRPDFQLTGENHRQVARICQLVQGMPLAIELAAAWLELLSTQEVLEEIQRSLDFLETSMRDVPARQRSIRAVFEASWNQLTAVEQRVFKKLSIFQGGFTRRAAQSVSQAGLPHLAALVNKSLVQREANGRFEIHELLRQYANEQLRNSPEEWRATRDRHSAYFSQFLDEMGQALRGPGQKTAYDEIQSDLDNVRAAWSWMVENRKVEEMDKAIFGVIFYYSRRVLGRELDQQLDRAIQAVDQGQALSPPEKFLLAKLLAMRASSYFEFSSGQPEVLSQQALDLVMAAGGPEQMGGQFVMIASTFGWYVEPLDGIRLLKAGLELAEEGGNRWEAATCLRSLGELYSVVGQPDEARLNLFEAIQLFRELGDLMSLADTLSILGEVLGKNQEHEQATRCYEESYRIYEELEDRMSASFVLENLGKNMMSMGDYPAAIRNFQEAAEYFLQIGDRMVYPNMLSWESIATVRYGDLPRARELRERSMKMSYEINDLNGMIWCNWELGEIERLEGNYERARRLFAESLRLFQSNKIYSLHPFYQRAMGDLALMEGDYVEARKHFQESVSQGLDSYNFWISTYALASLARADIGLVDLTAAQEHLKESLAAVEKTGDRGLLTVVIEGYVELFAARGEWEKVVEAAARLVDDPATFHEFRNLAKAFLSKATGHLSPGQFATVQERGHSMTLEAVSHGLNEGD